jgi:hypothetical protein
MDARKTIGCRGEISATEAEIVPAAKVVPLGTRGDRAAPPRDPEKSFRARGNALRSDENRG